MDTLVGILMVFGCIGCGASSHKFTACKGNILNIIRNYTGTNSGIASQRLERESAPLLI